MRLALSLPISDIAPTKRPIERVVKATKTNFDTQKPKPKKNIEREKKHTTTVYLAQRNKCRKNKIKKNKER